MAKKKAKRKADKETVGKRIKRGFGVLKEKLAVVGKAASEMNENAQKNAEPIKIIDESILGNIGTSNNDFFDMPKQDKR